MSGCKEAELTKLLENTFRHVNIALVNELAMFAHELDMDVWEAIDAASTKPFGYMRFVPGPGVGGHCRSLGHTFRFVELANDVNEHMPDYVVRRVMEHLNDRELPVRGQRVVLLGMAYKRNTGDARETPSAPIARALECSRCAVLSSSLSLLELFLPPLSPRTPRSRRACLRAWSPI